MEPLLEAIRAAVSPNTSHEARVAGASACRTILAALESIPGQPVAAAAVIQPSLQANIANVVGALRSLPADALLDLAVAKLRAALPMGVVVPQAVPIKFQIIPDALLETLAGGKAPCSTISTNATSSVHAGEMR